MAKSALRFLLIFVGAGMVFGSSVIVWAQPPDIHIDLNFDKTSYAYGEPVGVEVVVTNDGEELLINKGFSSLVYYLHMRVIDPAGRLLMGKRDEIHDEFPNTPPLPYVEDDEGNLIQVADCEALPHGSLPPSQTEDLRAHYALDLPGNYSAQVQLSVMIFKGAAEAPCNVNDYEWLGVLESEIRYFRLQGNTEGVKVIPNQWKLSWKDDEKKTPDVQVQLIAEAGKTLEDYDPTSIRLNNLEPVSVRILSPTLKVYFNAREAMEKLGNVEVGQWYWVLISGRFKNGQPFGFEEKIRVVN